MFNQMMLSAISGTITWGTYSYSNTYGSGNRADLKTNSTTTLSDLLGTKSDLFDGTTGVESSPGAWAVAGFTGSGQYLEVDFQTTVRFTEWTDYMSDSYRTNFNACTWNTSVWDGSQWVSTGSVSWGNVGSTAKVHTMSDVPENGFTKWRITCTAGSFTQSWWREITYKIAYPT